MHCAATMTRQQGARASLGAAELFLGTLCAYAPGNSLLEVRYRAQHGQLSRFFMSIRVPSAARIITQIGQRTDVYAGCAPRTRPSGRREDIAPTALLWADCDSPQAIAALHTFQPAPSIILESGTPAHAHGFWALTSTLQLHALEDANRRLARALGADAQCADGARILLVPGTFNFKHAVPRPVRLHRYTRARYRPSEILAILPPTPRSPAARGSRSTTAVRSTDDPLQRIAPADYVRVLTGREPGRDHKIACPLHTENTPSFHVYPTPERGWTCFGCTTPTGKPRGGDIYTLASLIWHVPTTGRNFIDLRHRLDELFGVRRG